MTIAVYLCPEGDLASSRRLRVGSFQPAYGTPSWILRISDPAMRRALAGSGRPSGSSPPPGITQAKCVFSLK